MIVMRSSETAGQSSVYAHNPQKTEIICNYKMKAPNSNHTAHGFG
jgi:hypothetical protein